ncbi:hypothetical protein Nos7524_1629 [Nostoc sp. PCC 7524]|uniref:hypothetical protein n=1 Tax=Nostoc sp. (strain ATCC 29411 / PCC 7524) TaxID=28072 RepID=UPI00029F4D8D|nr:hypothetical protein [Nostoc sp. PCC 7524]AFY47502.1 hypothetical protein Nos7524_1629 [Nostoc sp. PCC 7524]
MKPQQDYTTLNRPGDYGTSVTHLPSISSCHAWGRTPDQARGELVYVFEMVQPEYEEQNRSQPDNFEPFSVEEERQQLR